MPIALDGIRTCISGIRAHSASDCTPTAGTPPVSRNKHFRHTPVSSIVKQACMKHSHCVCMCVCVYVCVCVCVCVCARARRACVNVLYGIFSDTKGSDYTFAASRRAEFIHSFSSASRSSSVRVLDDKDNYPRGLQIELRLELVWRRGYKPRY